MLVRRATDNHLMCQINPKLQVRDSTGFGAEALVHLVAQVVYPLDGELFSMNSHFDPGHRRAIKVPQGYVIESELQLLL